MNWGHHDRHDLPPNRRAPLSANSGLTPLWCGNTPAGNQETTVSDLQRALERSESDVAEAQKLLTQSEQRAEFLQGQVNEMGVVVRKARSLEKERDANLRAVKAAHAREQDFAALQERYEALQALVGDKQRFTEQRLELDQSTETLISERFEFEAEREAFLAEQLAFDKERETFEQQKAAFEQHKELLESERRDLIANRRELSSLAGQLSDEQLLVLEERAELNEERRRLRGERRDFAKREKQLERAWRIVQEKSGKRNLEEVFNPVLDPQLLLRLEKMELSTRSLTNLSEGQQQNLCQIGGQLSALLSRMEHVETAARTASLEVAKAAVRLEEAKASMAQQPKSITRPTRETRGRVERARSVAPSSSQGTSPRPSPMKSGGGGLLAGLAAQNKKLHKTLDPKN
ncbi:MAG: hypothetical protein P1V97_19270 [Planctomycetota bacterium]|nr:hypothetical protein [Planctomycetota bacterium]